MRTIDAYADLLLLGKPVLTTEEASLRLRTTVPSASKLLARLAAAGLVVPIRRGLYATVKDLSPLLLPDHLTAPYPSYVSLQTALSLHGMIDQIPQVTYVASLGPTRRIRTKLGVFSVHQIAPGFFGGFDVLEPSGVKLASPAKALLDFLYLRRAKSRLFVRLPELELTSAFDLREARRWIERIPAPYQRTMVERQLEAILAAQVTPGGRKAPVRW